MSSSADATVQLPRLAVSNVSAVCIIEDILRKPPEPEVAQEIYRQEAQEQARKNTNKKSYGQEIG